MAEPAYAFRKRLAVVHAPDWRDPAVLPGHADAVVGEGWSVVVARDASALLLGVAQDLQDYLLISMGVSVLLRRVEDIAAATQPGSQSVVLATTRELPEEGAALTVARSYRLRSTADLIVICGFDERGAAQGSYFLEDQMNLRAAPFLAPADVQRQPLFSPRMIHSGWGLDEFPDAHLNAIAHAGLDAILLFVTGVDRTPDEHTHRDGLHGTGRHRDIGDLIDRAAHYGLDVYLYSYLRSEKALSDPDAEAYYDSTYGALFQAYPQVKGVILVGESVEFPSSDPRTTRRLRLTPSPDGLPADKPSPGWWPCTDYPEWLTLLKRVIRRHAPNAEIVFWTYNWGYAPEADRLALIRRLPEDITLQVTFEMFEQLQQDGITSVCVDYTVAFPGPGRYFQSEAEVAHERGIRLYTMSNTGGLTWDIGVIPYEPVPYQWSLRHAAVHQAREKWGLSGLMESHHFGWWPSFVSELAKWSYWSPSPSPEDVLAGIAQRDFGPAGAPHALAAWRHWSDAMADYVPTNEDQYGPFRVGPAYPLVFKRSSNMPMASHAMFGNMIVSPNYQPHDGARQSLGIARFPVEIRRLQRMATRWQDGIDALEQAVERAPDRTKAVGRWQLNLGHFIRNTIRTTIHLKQWWLLKQRLFTEVDPAAANAILDDMVTLAGEELANAEATIPFVEADSRLGWEPSMEYLGDAAHLRWKIAQVRRMLDGEIPAYRQSLALTVASETAT